jgi:DNA-binding transcriptional regulator YbjK
MRTNRERALDAAIRLLAEGGPRALTHARVDAAAGLPRGSASNDFRTRSALLAGVTDAIVQLEAAETRAALEPATAADLVDLCCALLDFATVEQRTVTTARLALFLESAHEPGLAGPLTRGRAVLEEAVQSMLARLGAPDVVSGAAALMACFEGLLLHRIARGDDGQARAAFTVAVRGALRD